MCHLVLVQMPRKTPFVGYKTCKSSLAPLGQFSVNSQMKIVQRVLEVQLHQANSIREVAIFHYSHRIKLLYFAYYTIGAPYTRLRSTYTIPHILQTVLHTHTQWCPRLPSYPVPTNPVILGTGPMQAYSYSHGMSRFTIIQCSIMLSQLYKHFNFHLSFN